MNGCGLRPPHDVKRDGLMGIAAETADFEIEVASIKRVGDGCAGPLNASMRLVQASQAGLSACLRASAARWAAIRTEVL